MKALNDLYDNMRRDREERRIYKALRHIDPWIARDIGFHKDDETKRARPFV